VTGREDQVTHRIHTWSGYGLAGTGTKPAPIPIPTGSGMGTDIDVKLQVLAGYEFCYTRTALVPYSVG